MKKVITMVSLCSVLLFGGSIKQPIDVLQTDGGVTDMIHTKTKLYVSTKSSCVDIFDLKTRKKLSKIVLPKIKDFMGDEVDAKVYSVDILGDELMMLAQANHGYRVVYSYNDGKLGTLLPISKKLYIEHFPHKT